MPDLRAQIGESYERHPDFAFGDATLPIDRSELDELDNSYGALALFRGRLALSERRSDATRSRGALSRVFAALRRSARDSYEERFLVELLAESRRLLDDEIEHYARSARPKPLRFRSAAGRAGAVRLETQRYFFECLPADAVRRIQHIAAAQLEELRANARAGRLSREDLSVSSGPVVGAIVRVLNRAFARLGVIEATSTYMRMPMTVTGVALELSVPQAGWWKNGFGKVARAPATLYAHCDEGISTCKAIVYLSDVAVEHGPTSIYPHAFDQLGLGPTQELVGRVVGSVGTAEHSPLRDYYAKAYHQAMTSERFRRHFMRLPPEIRFNSHFGWDVLPDSAFERSLVACERPMLGPAGTFVVFDGARLVHRGGLVQTGERVALQIVFSNVRLRDRARYIVKGLLS